MFSDEAKNIVERKK